jgi:hypothetical protein
VVRAKGVIRKLPFESVSNSSRYVGPEIYAIRKYAYEFCLGILVFHVPLPHTILGP